LDDSNLVGQLDRLLEQYKDVNVRGRGSKDIIPYIVSPAVQTWLASPTVETFVAALPDIEKTEEAVKQTNTIFKNLSSCQEKEHRKKVDEVNSTYYVKAEKMTEELDQYGIERRNEIDKTYPGEHAEGMRATFKMQIEEEIHLKTVQGTDSLEQSRDKELKQLCHEQEEKNLVLNKEIEKTVSILNTFKT
jgi:hypothetical protein